MPEFEVFAVAVMGLGFGAYFFIKGFDWFRRKRLMEGIPTSKVRSIAMGLVEIAGKANPKTLLKGPFSGKECVYYKYTIEEYRREGKHSRWVKLKEGSSDEKFYLEDYTGKVLVDPKEAEVDIPIDCEIESGFGEDPPETIKKFISSVELSYEGFLGLNKTMRYREYHIAPGDNLFIIGTAMDNPEMEEGAALKGHEDVMICKGNNWFYISDTSEKNVVEYLAFKTWGGLFGGMALIVGCLFYIFSS